MSSIDWNSRSYLNIFWWIWRIRSKISLILASFSALKAYISASFLIVMRPLK